MITYRCLWVLLIFSTILVGIASPAYRKPYTMSVLNIIQLTGVKPQNGRACKAASQLVIDVINNRTDVLVDYNIVMSFEDEGDGYLPPRLIANYSRSFETNNTFLQSPIVLGPFLSTGCKAIGPFLHHLNTVEISTICGAPILSDRKRFPNLHLMFSGGDSLAYTIVRFLKDVGKWRRIALLTNAASVNDYGTALVIQRVAISERISVPYFNIILDIDDDVIFSIKASDARIIVSYISFDRLVWRLLCQTYKFGLTGSKYIFVVNAVGYSDPRAIDPGCNGSNVIEQLKYTFWAGPLMSPITPNSPSQLGYNAIEFDAKLDVYLEKSRPGDYDYRFLCHDTVLRGLLALDATDRALRLQNLTLRNFTTHGKEIGKLVNATVTTMSYVGLRNGLVEMNRWGQMDDDLGLISYWSDQAGLYGIHTNRHKENTDTRHYSNYLMAPFISGKSFNWSAWKGSIPNDEQRVQHNMLEVHPNGYQAVLATACVFGCFQAIALCITIFMANSERLARGFPRSKCVGYIGAILLDAAAVSFAAKTFVDDTALPAWTLRITLIVIGADLVYGVVSLRVVTLSAELRNFQHSIAPTPNPSTFAFVGTAINPNLINDTIMRRSTRFQTVQTTHDSFYRPSYNNHTPHSVQGRANDLLSINQGSRMQRTSARAAQAFDDHQFSAAGVVIRVDCADGPPEQVESEIAQLPFDIAIETDKLAASATIGFAVVKGIILAVWLFCDPLQCTLNLSNSDSKYDSESDTYVETKIASCTSKYNLAWILSIALLHVIELTFALFCLYQINRGVRSVECPEHHSISFALNNALIILIATMLVVVALQTQVAAQAAISVATLILSGVSSLTWLFPLVQEGYHKVLVRISPT